MTNLRPTLLGSLLLLTLAPVMLIAPGSIYAAQRTVVGELYSADG